MAVCGRMAAGRQLNIGTMSPPPALLSVLVRTSEKSVTVTDPGKISSGIMAEADNPG
jgi:hypothetical protein